MFGERLCGSAGASHWCSEDWALLRICRVRDSALSVARRFCDRVRRNAPPLAPPPKGGEASRKIRGGGSPLLWMAPPLAPPSKGGKVHATFVAAASHAPKHERWLGP